MKISVNGKDDIRRLFTSGDSVEIRKRLAEFPKSVVCSTRDREMRGAPFAIYDSPRSAREDLGADAHYGVTPLSRWFL